MTEIITEYFESYWDGPYDVSELDEVHSNNVLYLICGTHGMYGRNVPLYIGKTEQEVKRRIAQHDYWLREEPDPPKVYVACIGSFSSWKENALLLEYPPLDRETIESVESLLIYAHQPVYNAKSRQGNIRLRNHFVVFNTGRRGTLYPEVSSLRWLSDKEA